MKRPGKDEREHWAFEFGTDPEYLEWVSYQPSCVDGSFNQYQDDGTGRNIGCHVRRLNRGSGGGFKPKYSAIPMTNEQHMNEERYTIEWRVEQADEHLRRWVEGKKSGWW